VSRRRRARVRLASAVLAAFGLASAGVAQAQAVAPQWHGHAELRVGHAGGDDRSWLDGGLGKVRFGAGSADPQPAAALAMAWQLAPAWLVSTQLQYQDGQRRPFGVLDAWVRWRPVSTTPWRWSVKAGAFFPPISLENDGIGWTSPLTLTPSAINSWVGEELRATGTEFALEHRSATATWRGIAAAFDHNDPAGDLLASRGWAMGDVTSALNAELREPDVYAGNARVPAPVVFRPFTEIDHRIGWYAGLSREGAGGSLLSLLRYDNRGDPTAWEWQGARKVFAWHTRFWSTAARGQVGGVQWLAQAMDGATAFEPREGLYLDTRFSAAYVLVAWERGDWQPALRFDLFRARQLPESPAAPLGEHGNAITAALNWRPREGLRITGELLRIDSTRHQRMLEGLSPRQSGLQAQVGVRVSF
jgi:hypothetical protein